VEPNLISISKNFSHSSSTCTNSYDMDAVFMSFEQHESGIHALCSNRGATGGLYH